MVDLSRLEELCSLRATPGDEGQVGRYLLDVWNDCGWQTGTLGRYVVYAESPDWDDARPTVMLCAHMDSPGFVIQSAAGGDLVAVALGGAHFDEESVAVVGPKGCGTLRYGPEERTFLVTCTSGSLERGDRLCYAPLFQTTGQGLLKATFLDNRVGCWGLCRAAETLGKTHPQGVNVRLAATCCEEMTGFGADVLAARFGADVVVCLDATYIDPVQNVVYGGGPVLTVTDKSTLLSPAVCASVSALFQRWGIPLQTEYYNYSGTDARSFPAQGFAGPVYSLLLGTEGNHGPGETASLADLGYYEEMVLAFCRDSEGVNALRESWERW